MRTKKVLGLCVPVAALIITLFNGCKKETSGSIESLMARGTWQLASVHRFNYIGSTNTSTDTLNATCTRTQTLTFNENNTCTYVNFSCIEQKATGSWQLADDKLTLISQLTCQDTSGKAIITTKPFINARIVNAGQFSLVLETGDINSYYKATDVRHIKRYGFIRQ